MPNEQKPFEPIHDVQHHSRKSVLFFLIAVAALLVVAAALVTWMQTTSSEFDASTSNIAIRTSNVSNTGSPVGSYVAYSDASVSSAQDSGDRVVLFFHQDACPVCKTTDENLRTSASSREIPGGVSIIKVNFDGETALKTKYNVQTPHTFVQIDEDQNQVTRWVGTQNLSEILAKVK